MKGEGCAQNREYAFKLFKKGADRGDIESQNALGISAYNDSLSILNFMI